MKETPYHNIDALLHASLVEQIERTAKFNRQSIWVPLAVGAGSTLAFMFLFKALITWGLL